MENTVQLISKIAIWAAMFGWVVAMATRYCVPQKRRIANGWWLFALIVFAIHIVTAFHGFYEWSIRTALDETARLTEDLTGWSSSVGLWVNFAFFAALAADFAMRIFREGGVCKTQNRVVQVLVIFMIVNGAIIFADGPVRCFGISLLVGLVVVIWYANVQHRKHS
ncbi:hypothetical protein OAE61_05570 [Verrucomicrobiales bacterium]|nr:hypothetical protein [Verrucomicrobiales bacterium]MDB4663085.1 hypothetical protein [Verrucomicrobiales bacterium]